MNTLAERAVAANNPTDKSERPLLRRPLVLWAVVLCVAMMSFYVHLLGEQVQRGERLRQAQRGMPQQQALHGPTPSEVSLAAAR